MIRRFVLDTNILISTLLCADSVPGVAFARAGELGEVVYSVEALQELVEVLARPKLERLIDEEDREEFIADFLAGARLIRPAETITDCRDPKDNKFLELAIAGGVSAIITGDQDLLALHPYRGIQILTPADFLAQYLGQ